MVRFNNSWIKGKDMNTRERIRDSVRTPQPLRSSIDMAKNKIEIQNQKLSNTLEKLRGKEKSLFNQVIVDLQKHDVQEGKIISNELAQVRRTIKTVSQLKMGLERMQLRLESTINIGDVMAAIDPAMGSLTKIKSGLVDVIPTVDTHVGQITGVLNDIMINAENKCDSSFAFETRSEEADKILNEASILAEQRMNDNFPDVPIETSSSSKSSVREHSY